MAPPHRSHNYIEVTNGGSGGAGAGYYYGGSGRSTPTSTTTTIKTAPATPTASTTRRGVTKLTMLIAGKHGLGKSSLLSTLFPQAIQPPMQRTTIIKDEEYLCSLRSTGEPIKYSFDHLVGDEEDDLAGSEKINLLITDMPGYSDEISPSEYIEMLKKEVIDPFGEVLYEEGRIHRNPKFVDNRVHCLLFLIDPIPGHGVRELDLKIIKELAPLVNVVPLLAKSDLWISPGDDDNIESYYRRSEELNKCRMEVRKALEGVEYFDLEEMVRKNEAYRIEEEREKNALLSVSMSSTKSSIRNLSRPSLKVQSPLAVMGANRIVRISQVFNDDGVDGKSFIVNPIDSTLLPTNNERYRRYHWGHLSCDDINVSDVNLLSTLLLKVCRSDLREKTNDDLYERFRTEKLLERKEAEI